MTIFRYCYIGGLCHFDVCKRYASWAMHFFFLSLKRPDSQKFIHWNIYWRMCWMGKAMCNGVKNVQRRNRRLFKPGVHRGNWKTYMEFVPHVLSTCSIPYVFSIRLIQTEDSSWSLAADSTVHRNTQGPACYQSAIIGAPSREKLPRGLRPHKTQTGLLSFRD